MKKITTEITPDRRKFLTNLGLLGMATITPLSLIAAKEKMEIAEDLAILKAGPYLQAPTTNTMVIRWITTYPCYSWVEYGQDEHHLDQKSHTVRNGLVQANNRIHAITIENLNPGQKYFYRICSKQIKDFQPYNVIFGNTYRSSTYYFTTFSERAEKASFLVFNDVHDHPESFEHLMQFQGEGENDFVILNGDMFDHAQDEEQMIGNLLEPVSSLFSKSTPFYFVCGNHETRGGFSRQLPKYFYEEESSKFYFSFEQGPVYIIVLDSGEDKEDTAPVYAGLVDFDQYRMQQAEWLKNEVQKENFKKAKYKIVFSHIPLYHAGEWHGTVHCRETWGPILNEAKIDLLISGHTHKYGIHLPEQGKHNYPIVIGGGPQVGNRTIIKVKADKENLNLDMIDDQGETVGNIRL